MGLSDEQQQMMLEFVRGMIAVRKAEPVFRRQKFFQGRSIREGETSSDVGWIGTDGKDVTMTSGTPASRNAWACDWTAS